MQPVEFHASQQPAPATAPVGLAVAWLITLRWGAVLGQAATVMVASELVGARLPVGPLLLVIGLTALSNLVLTAWPSERLSQLVLVADTISLTALLALSGGAANPFYIFYLVHLVMAVVMLPPRWIWLMSALVLVGYGVVLVAGLPLVIPDAGGEPAPLDLPRAYRDGKSIAFALVVLLTALFATRVLQALMNSRTLAHRNARLAAVTTLAAGAAHELGTPLGTIALVARELERALSRAEDSELRERLAEDVALIRSEVARCRVILDHMVVDGVEGDSDGTIVEVLDELALLLGAERWQRVSIECDAELRSPQGGTFPVRTLAQALISPLQNALQAVDLDQGVTIEARLDEPGGDRLRVHIRDRGVGMPPELLARACEPFFTTRQAGEGKGLGLFLTRVVIERLGGTLDIDSSPGEGTTVTIRLTPRPGTSG